MMPGIFVALAACPAATPPQCGLFPAVLIILPSVIFPGERDILRVDLDRLTVRLEAYDR